MYLDSTLGLPVTCPGILVQAELDDGGVDQMQAANLLRDVVKAALAADVGDDAPEHQLQKIRIQAFLPAGESGGADGVDPDLLFQLIAVQADDDAAKTLFLFQLSKGKNLDQCHRCQLLDIPVNVQILKLLAKLRKNRKELLKCGLFGILVHVVLPYFRDYGQGLPCYNSIIRDFSSYFNIYTVLSLTISYYRGYVMFDNGNSN